MNTQTRVGAVRLWWIDNKFSSFSNIFLKYSSEKNHTKFTGKLTIFLKLELGDGKKYRKSMECTIVKYTLKIL